MTLSPADALFRYCMIFVLVLFGMSFSAPPAQAQMGFDRPGGDYAHTSVLTRDPSDCALLCERDKRCRAWSFNFPRDTQANAVCWLKTTLPPRIADGCCISGVRGAGVVEPQAGPFEMFIDRFGGDYKDFEVKGGDGGERCQQACTDDTKCRAWTFARPGYSGRDARCFLKGEIKPPRRAPGLVSGVVR